MGAVRITILVVAAIAAIVLMVIVGRLISHKPAPPPVAAAPAKPMTRVVVAAHDLPIGQRVTAQDLTWQPWPADAVNPAFVTDGQSVVAPPAGTTASVASQTTRAAAEAVSAVTGAHSPMESMYGAIVKTPILANEPVTGAKLVRGGEGGFLSVVLRPGMRAIAIPVDVKTDAGGFILPGDRVDVLQARQVDQPGSGGQRPYVVMTLLHNVRVLAIDQNATPPKGGAQSVIGSVATIEVSPADAEAVALAKVQGEMVLTLRSYADSAGASGGSGGSFKIGTVRIIRNGQASDTTVTP
jgi:pilus assembly protein CpaB